MAYKQVSPRPIAEGGTNTSLFTATNSVVYYDGAELNNTGAGVTSEVLTSNGPGMPPSFQAVGSGSGGITLIQTQTAAGVTNLVFNTGIGATYNNYWLMYYNCSLNWSAGTNSMLMQLSNDGGMTFDTTNYYFFNPAGAGSLVASSGLVVQNFSSTAGGSPSAGNIYFWGNANVFSFTAANNLPSMLNQNGVTEQSSAYTVTNTIINSFYNAGPFSVNAFNLTTNNAKAFSGTFSLYCFTT